MNATTSVWVRFDLYEYGSIRPHPRDIYKTVTPTPIQTKWVPQTIKNEVWVFYDFGSAEAKQQFLANTPDAFDRADILANEAQVFLDHWTR